MPESSKRPKINRKLQLVLLVVLFLVPPVAAYILFYTDFQPSSGANYGQLVRPVKPISDVVLVTPENREFKFSELRTKWVLLYLGDSHCDEICSNNLYKMHQVRLAQGKNMERVNSVYIVPENTLQTQTHDVRERYPGLLVLRAPADVFSDLIDQLRSNVEMTSQSPERVYIVDPLGNLMMSYHAQADPSGMRKDLKRLLKLSQIG